MCWYYCTVSCNSCYGFTPAQYSLLLLRLSLNANSLTAWLFSYISLRDLTFALYVLHSKKRDSHYCGNSVHITLITQLVRSCTARLAPLIVGLAPSTDQHKHNWTAAVTKSLYNVELIVTDAVCSSVALFVEYMLTCVCFNVICGYVSRQCKAHCWGRVASTHLN